MYYKLQHNYTKNNLHMAYTDGNVGLEKKCKIIKD